MKTLTWLSNSSNKCKSLIQADEAGNILMDTILLMVDVKPVEQTDLYLGQCMGQVDSIVMIARELGECLGKAITEIKKPQGWFDRYFQTSTLQLIEYVDQLEDILLKVQDLQHRLDSIHWTKETIEANRTKFVEILQEFHTQMKE